MAAAAAWGLSVAASAAPAPPAQKGSSAMMGPAIVLDPETARRGAATYAARCAACHSGGAERAPGRFTLSMMTPESIVRALEDGVMKPMSEGLSLEDRHSVAQYLTQKRMTGRAASPRMCGRGVSPFDFGETPPFSGWGLSPGGDHAIKAPVSGLDPDRARRLKLKWAVAFPNAVRARSQPALGGGALFVGSHDGTVFALDRATGCARWTFRASAEVRTGIVLTPWKAGDRTARPIALFGDLVGNVYAVDAIDGTQIWKAKADPHPASTITGTPTYFEGRLIVPVSSLEEASPVNPAYACCTFRGSIIAFDATTGNRIWQTYMVDPPVVRGKTTAGAERLGPSGVAVWSSPTLDLKRRRIYVATGGNYSSPSTPLSDAVVALDLDDGRVAWAYQATPGDVWNSSCTMSRENCPEEDGPDFDFGAPPILTTSHDGEEFLLAGQKSGIVYGIDPQSGSLRWKTKVGRGGALGGVHFGMSAQGGRVFVPITDYGDYGKAQEGAPQSGLFSLDVKTGRVLWKYAVDACQGRDLCKTGFGSVPTAAGRVVLMGGDDGHLRALDPASGKLIWDYDTVRDFRTVNGETGKGGSMSGGHGPIAFRGVVFVNTGHGLAGKMPGNSLLAFEAQ